MEDSKLWENVIPTEEPPDPIHQLNEDLPVRAERRLEGDQFLLLFQVVAGIAAVPPGFSVVCRLKPQATTLRCINFSNQLQILTVFPLKTALLKMQDRY